jgi:hypothetical protein
VPPQVVLSGDPVLLTPTTVFLISGCGKDQLASWFDPGEKPGICMKHGHHELSKEVHILLIK